MDVHREVHDAYDVDVDRAHRGMVWSHPGMTAWHGNSLGRVVADLGDDRTAARRPGPVGARPH